MQAVSSTGTPMIIKTGAMMEPADSTEAVEEPVIMPGNMMMIMMKISISAGTLWKRWMISEAMASSAPDS